MINNKNLEEQTDEDSIIDLYHLNVTGNVKYLKDTFGDVKFVCMGGKANRMRELANYWREYNGEDKVESIYDYSIKGGRYSMFKENKVIFLSHGMGIPSISIALNEVAKLLHFSGVRDAVFIRIGTCGGLDLEPGTIVITEKCYDAKLDNYLEMFICGKSVKRPAVLNKDLAEEFLHFAQNLFKENAEFQILKANTLCANDFYEEQARVDGACNTITSEEKEAFFRKLVTEYNIRNIEMESLGFAAFCYNLQIKGLIFAVTMTDRLIMDKISIGPDTICHHQNRIKEILIKFLHMKINNLHLN